MAFEQYVNLYDNPLFVKHLRSRLRKGTIRTSLVIVSILSFLLCFLQFQAIENAAPVAKDGVGLGFFFMLYSLQSLILYLLGGSQIAGAVSYIKETGILEFHRVTPTPSGVQALGFLLGAPIREWVLYAVTMPFSIFLALQCSLGIENFGILTIVQLLGALFYHTLAIVIGLTGTKARGSSGRYVGVVVMLNFASNAILPTGVHGPFLFSPLPVIINVANQIQIEAQKKNPIQFQRPIKVVAEPKFFSISLPLVLETILTQSLLISFLFLAIMRRFRSERIPIYTKKQALLFFSSLAFLTFGTLWDTAAPAIMLGSAYFLAVSSLLFTIPMTVPLGDYIRGLQRSKKMGTGSVSIWSHLASNRNALLIMAFISAIGLVSAAAFAPKPNPARMNWAPIFNPWGPVVVSILTTLTFGWAYQYFHLRHGKRANSVLVMFLFLFWVTPILVFGILAATSGNADIGALLGVSPFFGIAFSSFAQFAPNQKQADEVWVLLVCIVPIAMQMIYFYANLLRQESKLQAAVSAEISTSVDSIENE